MLMMDFMEDLGEIDAFSDDDDDDDDGNEDNAASMDFHRHAPADFAIVDAMSTDNNSLEGRSTSGGSTTATSHSSSGVQQQKQKQQQQQQRQLTGRPPIKLYLTCDHTHFSEYQIIVRNNVELFEATLEDVESNAQGRNHPIVLGQVGIRCRHCNFVPPRQRKRGATYYPSKLLGLYQATQNLAVSHLMVHCNHVPRDIRDELIRLRDQKSAIGGGKMKWAKRAHALGVYEDDDGLRFASRLDAFASTCSKATY